LVKSERTYLSKSKNYFWEGTLPPPSFFSKYSSSSGSLVGALGLQETTKASSGHSWGSAYGFPRF